MEKMREHKTLTFLCVCVFLKSLCSCVLKVDGIFL